MRSTLFYIPHEFFGLPLLGFGWMLILLCIGACGWAYWLHREGRLQEELTSGLPIWAIAAAIIIFVLPQIETVIGGEPIGLPVRGYGVMVLLGLFSGIGITMRRANQLRLPPDLVVSLGFWMMMIGVLGARIFYVVQKWDEDFAPLGFTDRLIAIVKLTEGGLVIYGGMIGGLVALLIYSRKHRLKPLAIADLITPGFLIGLAFGRIGCLLNGCCFGGVCAAELPSITFPQGSPPFAAQIEDGHLLGLSLKSNGKSEKKIASVDANSIALEKFHAKPGETFNVNRFMPQLPPKGIDPAQAPDLAVDLTIGGRRDVLLPSDLPHRSLPVHPSQIYSAIDALLLCCLIYWLQPWVRRDGQAFFTGVTLHGVARFTLELIRSDEAGQFGTSLTIAQWISIIGGGAALIAIIVTMRMPAQRFWNWQLAK